MPAGLRMCHYTSLQIPELTLFSNMTGISAREFTIALVHQGPMEGQYVPLKGRVYFSPLGELMGSCWPI